MTYVLKRVPKMRAISCSLTLCVLFCSFLPGNCEASPKQLTVRLFSSAHGPIQQIRIRGPFAIGGAGGRAYCSSRTYASGDYIAGCKSQQVILKNAKSDQIVGRDRHLNLVSVGTEGIALTWDGAQRNYKGTVTMRSVPFNKALNTVAKPEFGLYVTNQVDRQDYLASVIASEMPIRAGLQAMRAQAVLTNTLIESLHDGVEISDSTELQSYKGLSLSRPLASHAAELSNNEILVYNGKPIHVFFHSTCAGMTSKAEDIFGGKGADSFPYLQNVSCSFCKLSPFWHEHTCQIPKDRFAALFGADLPTVISQDKASRPTLIRYLVKSKEGQSSGYAFWLKIGQKFGWDKAPGTRFSLSAKEGFVEIKSTGAGHGVGLCQWGAIGMDEKGKKYKEILSYYFPGTHVTSRAFQKL